MTADPVTFEPRPTRFSGGVAVAAGAAAMWLVVDTVAQREALVVAVGGLVAFSLGVAWWRGGRRAVGVPLALAGAGVVLAAVSMAAQRPPLLVHRFELLPGLFGLWAIAAGVLQVRVGWERRLVSAGAALVLASVLISGVVRGASLTALLAAATVSVVAWDAGENAVSLGRQLGADADTTRAEVVHVAASGVVAVAAVLLSLGVHRLGVTGLPFAALAALLAAGVVLALVHHQ